LQAGGARFYNTSKDVTEELQADGVRHRSLLQQHVVRHPPCHAALRRLTSGQKEETRIPHGREQRRRQLIDAPRLHPQRSHIFGCQQGN
jgi:hypothetical protein